MIELNLNPGKPACAPEPSPPQKPPSRWKRATLAGLLSLLFPGMGQLLNRRPRKGLALAIVTLVLGLLLAETQILLTFPTMVAAILISLGWRLFIPAEAAFSAATGKKPEARILLPRLTYSVIAVVILVATLFPSADQVKRGSGFSAFVVPSGSMCPTICVGDRIVADMHAYKSKLPQRGDLILLKHPMMDALLIKRVIGVPGDVVAPGPNNIVLVNNEPFHPPAPCGSPPLRKQTESDYPVFQPANVPEGTYFVVGDDLGNSLDSRISGFGVVTPGMVRGKPLFFYWSRPFSRIGCRAR